MYLEYERRARLAELDAKYFHPRLIDGVRLQEPNALERAVTTLWAWLQAALAQRDSRAKGASATRKHGSGAIERASCA